MNLLKVVFFKLRVSWLTNASHSKIVDEILSSQFLRKILKVRGDRIYVQAKDYCGSFGIFKNTHGSKIIFGGWSTTSESIQNKKQVSCTKCKIKISIQLNIFQVIDSVSWQKF